MKHDWGYVYAIAGAGKVKIGITSNPQQRLRNLSTMCPVDLEMVCHRSFATYDLAGKIERMLHARFAEHRWRGEWFDMPATFAVEAIDDAFERYGDPEAGPRAFVDDVAAQPPPKPDYSESDARLSKELGYDFGAMRLASKALDFSAA